MSRIITVKQKKSVANTVCKIGAPHFRVILNQYRHSNYSLGKGIFEFIDNSKSAGATEINTEYKFDDEGKLYRIKVSDNVKNGMLGLNEEGNKNPFKIGYENENRFCATISHTFGIGMKAAGGAMSDRLECYTKNNETYKYVDMDFRKMSEEPDVMKSYDPDTFNITKKQYQNNHPYTEGTTLICQVRREHIPSEKKEEVIKNLIMELLKTYNKSINNNNLRLLVNNIEIVPERDIFSDKYVLKIKGTYYIPKNNNTHLNPLLEKTNYTGKTTYYEKQNNTWKQSLSVSDSQKELLYTEIGFKIEKKINQKIDS